MKITMIEGKEEEIEDKNENHQIIFLKKTEVFFPKQTEIFLNFY